jgi:hypothetical protein
VLICGVAAGRLVAVLICGVAAGRLVLCCDEVLLRVSRIEFRWRYEVSKNFDANLEMAEN